MHKIRAEITKGETVRYISHLDYASAMERAVRRARLPAAYSEGFNPHMKLAFASALAVGVTSRAEYMDIELKVPVPVEEFCARLRATLPEGIELLKAKEIVGKQAALMAVVDLAVYEVKAPFSGDAALLQEAIGAFNRADVVRYMRETPKSKKEIEIKQFMASPIEVHNEAGVVTFDMRIKMTPSGSVKPGEVVRALCGQFGVLVEAAQLLIDRTGLYAGGKTPMEL